MMIKEKIFEQMKLLSTHFEIQSKNYSLFLPEYDYSRIINTIIENLETFNKENIDIILNVINSINHIKHYNGSGWLDYKLQLSALFHKNGYDIDIS